MYANAAIHVNAELTAASLLNATSNAVLGTNTNNTLLVNAASTFSAAATFQAQVAAANAVSALNAKCADNCPNHVELRSHSRLC